MKVNKKIKTTTRTSNLTFFEKVKKDRYLLLMLLPGVIYLLLFVYKPITGLLMAFQNYNIVEGIWGSEWVGFDHFKTFFSGRDFVPVMTNTLKISIFQLIIGSIMPIIFAIMVNELRHGIFKKVTQTVSYLPHFLSWVTVAGMMTILLSPSVGLINAIIVKLGFEPIYFLADKGKFVPILIISSVWKEIGWGSVIYLSSLAGLDQDVGEAAIIDGATRFQRIRYINMPYLFSTVGVMLIMRTGNILNAGFDQIFNLQSPATYDVANVLDIYVYKLGIQGFEYGLSTAIGLFKSVVGLVMILLTNWIVKKSSDGEISL